MKLKFLNFQLQYIKLNKNPNKFIANKITFMVFIYQFYNLIKDWILFAFITASLFAKEDLWLVVFCLQKKAELNDFLTSTYLIIMCISCLRAIQLFAY